MTPEQRRIAIAEACGWKSNGVGYWHRDGEVRALTWEDGEGRGSDVEALPDYLNDLNAMYEARSALSEHDKSFYWEHLHAISSGRTFFGSDTLPAECFDTMNAHAEQHAEAFLRTLNLRTE